MTITRNFARFLHKAPLRPAMGALVICVLAACDEADPPQPALVPPVEAPVEVAPADVKTSTSPPAQSAAAQQEPWPALLVQAQRLLVQGQYSPARDLATHYASGNPGDGRAELIIALTYSQAGNYAPAVPHFERAVALLPAQAPAHRYFGECLFLLGDLEGARREYDAFLIAAPSDPVAHYSVALVDIEEARLDEAERSLRHALELFEELGRADPGAYGALAAARARCHARLADVHLARRDDEAARDELVASTTIEPRNISAYFALSVVYRRLGDDVRAAEALARYESARRAIIGGRPTGDG